MSQESFRASAEFANFLQVAYVTIWTPDGWKAPKGFPRGELLCCPSQGGKTWRVKTDRLLKFCRQESEKA